MKKSQKLESNKKNGNSQTAIHESITSMEQLQRIRIESTFVSASFDVSLLPEIDLPDLNKIHVTAPLPPDRSEEEVKYELQARLEALVLEHAITVSRKTGEPVQEGDRIFVDVVTYVDGHIAGFGNYENLSLMLVPGVFLPGFAESMIGCVIGETVTLLTDFPDDYPEPSMSGKAASISVHLRAAEELQLLDPESQEFLARLNMGESLEQVAEQILAQMAEEWSAEFQTEVINSALGKLAENVVGVVSEKMLDAAIKEQWLQKQGKFLQSRDVPFQDREDALQQWIRNPEMRKEMRNRIAISLAVREAANRYELTSPPPEEFQQFLAQMSTTVGCSLNELNESLSKEPATLEAIFGQFLYIRTVDYITEHTQIEYQTC
ncbi:hypothetical protein L0152_13905 [bacterium]|nr:hypothetical protein [bacterium]